MGAMCCLFGPCGAMWKGSGGKFVIGNQLHDFFHDFSRLVKDLFDIFDLLLFFGVR